MEADFIHWLRTQVRSPAAPWVGIGDDAAVLEAPGGAPLVFTSDLLADGVHFELARCGADRAGRKALAANLSDLAAMAARPVAALISLALPRQGAAELARALYAGILPLAEEYGSPIIGGDTNCWDAPLAIGVTAIGLAGPRGPLLRSGARPGDEILVTGSLGGSRLGRHLDFTPRVREALRLHADFELHAAIDVSDGLSLDLSRLAEESGCGAEIELAAVPVSDDARQLAAGDDQAALAHALGDGEDFELLLAVPPDAARQLLDQQPLDVPLARIGRCVERPGLWQLAADGRRRPLPPRGYLHGTAE